MTPKPDTVNEAKSDASTPSNNTTTTTTTRVGPHDTSNLMSVVPMPATSTSHYTELGDPKHRGHLGARPTNETHNLNTTHQEPMKEQDGNPNKSIPSPPRSGNSLVSIDIDNPCPHTLAEGENATPLEVIGSSATDKLVIIMVGLPATGKTHIAKRICRFLSFFHDIPSQIFNVGDYRRQLCGTQLPASFYNPTNEEGSKQRHMACDAALSDLIEFMKQGESSVRVAAFDATNTTRSRRKYIIDKLKEKLPRNTKRMFIESICDSTQLLEENIRKVKLSTPDYKNVDPDFAVTDFLKRREQYMSVYEPLEEQYDGIYPYVKIINCRRFIVNNIRGYLPLKVVHFVMNLHTLPRIFFLTRHGQSQYNLKGKIGGDSSLTDNGVEYAKRLAVFAKEYIATKVVGDKPDASVKKDTDDDDDDKEKNKDDDNVNNDNDEIMDNNSISDTENRVKQRPARLWTSTLRRTKETAQFIEHHCIQHTWDNGDKGDWMQFRPMARRNLDELYAGTCDGMTYKEISEIYPDEFSRRQKDKLAYRYPRGESYMDVTLRLEPLAHEMERTREPILIIGHQGILRIIYAYFMGLDRKDAPYVSIPLNNVIELSPHAYGCNEKRFCLMTKEEMTNKTLRDGQDEPITSMPMPSKEEAEPITSMPMPSTTPNDTTNTNTNNDINNLNNSIVKKFNYIDGQNNNTYTQNTINASKQARDNDTEERRRRKSLQAIQKGTSSNISAGEEYDPSDDIMNAPSC